MNTTAEFVGEIWYFEILLLHIIRASWSNLYNLLDQKCNGFNGTISERAWKVVYNELGISSIASLLEEI